MEKELIYLILIFVLLYSTQALSVGLEYKDLDLTRSKLYPLSQISAVGYGLLIFVILIPIIILFSQKMNESTKKIVYILIFISVSLVTIYLVVTTLHLNFISETKGPVHWHADYEIWICDEEIKLEKPKGIFSNKQGTALLHSHQDNRIHVEGVLIKKEEASLGAFFYAIGGSISNNRIEVPTNDGMAYADENTTCNDKKSKLYVFVNGNLIDNYSDYTISQYEKVPPGDRIKIIFSEKNIEEINPNIR